MTNRNDPFKQPLPPEIGDLYRDKVITGEEVEPMLKLRHELMNAGPQPKEGFQAQLAQRLDVELAQQKKYFTGEIRLHKRFRGRAALIVVIVLALGVGAVLAVSAILQQFINYDAGLKAVFTAGNGIKLNQSQTVGNYTVNLQWANADSNRLTVGFTVSGFVCSSEYVNCAVRVEMFDRNWREISMIDGRADDGLSLRTYLYNFDLSGFRSNEVIMALQLQITPYGMTNDGTDPADPNITRGHSVSLGAPIVLNFEVPLSDEVRVLNTTQSATDKNIAIRLRRVVVSPSQTRLAICFVPPVTTRRWIAIPRLTTNGTEVAGGGAVDDVSGIGENADEICNEYIYNAAMYDYTGDWQLEITELVGFGSSGNDQQRIAGSWVFKFHVP